MRRRHLLLRATPPLNEEEDGELGLGNGGPWATGHHPEWPAERPDSQTIRGFGVLATRVRRVSMERGLIHRAIGWLGGFGPGWLSAVERCTEDEGREQHRRAVLRSSLVGWADYRRYQTQWVFPVGGC